VCTCVAEAEALREKHREATDAVDDVQSKISELEKKLETDYGPGMRFEPLSRECFMFTPGGEWDYELCPFKDAHQKSTTGGSTSIGRWEGFEGDDYSVMKFTNGQHCWNGPSRSLTVTLSCAEQPKILGVDEPEVCSYTMRFETPAACTDAHLAAASADVAALSLDDDVEHDEL
jgi:protein kinase C substrate 80K-H